MNKDGEHPYSAHGGLARYFVEHREVGWVALIAVLIWGGLAYRQLPQQEDPQLPARIARLVTVFPGATALQVEQLVTNPLEKKVAELGSMEEISSETRDGLSVISLGQHPERSAQVEQEWDRLRAKLSELTMPEGCLASELHTDFGDVVTMLIAVASTAPAQHSYRELEIVADQLEDKFQQEASVGRTRQLGAVQEVIHLLFSPAKINAANLSLIRVLETIRQRNQLLAGGTFKVGAEQLPAQIFGEFHNEDDLRNAIVGAIPDGQPIRIGDLFDVQRGEETPLPLHVELLRRTGPGALAQQRSVIIAVEMKSGGVISEFAQRVQAAVDRLRPQFPSGVDIVTISDQPKSVAHRIDHFSQCFAEAVLVVIAIALLLMEWRAALIVAIAIPLTVALTLGGMQLTGIPLHQISIAALIIALGMLVDDPVVAADGINREIANGRPREIAAWLGPFRLRRPIFFATLINILAFLPLVLLPGDKKFFIYALPVVVTLALVASRIVSMTFIPLLGSYLLRGQRGFDQGGQIRRGFPLELIDRALLAVLSGYRALLEAALRRPWLAVFIAYGLLAASCTLTPFFGRQFFPPAERNQFLIDVALPESASPEATRRVCNDITRLLRPCDEIISAALFIGGSAPRFYYNVTPKAPSEHLAQFLINTRRAEDVPGLIARLRTQLDHEITNARCVVKPLEQGPPVDTPIQIRLSGDDLDSLRHLADQVAGVIRSAGGYQVHDDLGPRVPTLKIDINQDRATALGVINAQLAPLLRATFASAKLTVLREGDHLVPVELRLRPEERGDLEKLRELRVDSLPQTTVPLREFAEIQRGAEYATIGRIHQRRTVTVKSYADHNVLPSDVLARAKPEIDRIALPPGFRLEYAGETRELKQSREEMGRVMLISLALIMLAMVIQFNSLAKSLVVMLTVPLGLIGGFVGLALFHAPLGFMAMLAIVSLAGVIVSHIIVLSDFIEEARGTGLDLKAALIQAGLVRMRPVLVTVLATAGGLVPLALTGGELWRPLTAVHIFGLLVATALTLFVLPVLYYVFSVKVRWIR